MQFNTLLYDYSLLSLKFSIGLIITIVFSYLLTIICSCLYFKYSNFYLDFRLTQRINKLFKTDRNLLTVYKNLKKIFKNERIIVGAKIHPYHPDYPCFLIITNSGVIPILVFPKILKEFKNRIYGSITDPYLTLSILQKGVCVESQIIANPVINTDYTIRTLSEYFNANLFGEIDNLYHLKILKPYLLNLNGFSWRVKGDSNSFDIGGYRKLKSNYKEFRSKRSLKKDNEFNELVEFYENI